MAKKNEIPKIGAGDKTGDLWQKDRIDQAVEHILNNYNIKKPI